ncbi:DUF1080 domain-containing protein [Mucilaginibacter sp. BT774]|uniref:3-keto-disaccharide hydrolase n=1 Tax=Mucilaginibacter sp. BT774 TaxID=3062276 RepID=UPI002674EFD5|nr:DUF1080 domain-containing protein [Mucilaginibacter sp. BT774]MDO3628942.1 DUF1080 domain-containing protein [Mucilaginibacter sp. BT774]
MKKLLFAIGLISCGFANAQQTTVKETPLFNGKDLKGWYSFLTSKGKNNDPENVFSVENGLLHITGKEFGYLCTEKKYKNFHLVAEFKWGIKKYPPRDADTIKRDNGIMYYVQTDAADKVWPKSIECQIQEGDVGDIWLIDSATVVTDGKRSIPRDFNRIVKKKNTEKPFGEWNTVEVIVDKGKITYVVNGIVVNTAESPSLNDGRIIIQSEGAEIYYRKIAIAEL